MKSCLAVVDAGDLRPCGLGHLHGEGARSSTGALTRTRSPGSILPDVPWRAMSAACGSVDASAKVSDAGLWTMGAVSGTRTYSANAPPPDT